MSVPGITLDWCLQLGTFLQSPMNKIFREYVMCIHEDMNVEIFYAYTSILNLKYMYIDWVLSKNVFDFATFKQKNTEKAHSYG